MVKYFCLRYIMDILKYLQMGQKTKRVIVEFPELKKKLGYRFNNHLSVEMSGIITALRWIE